MRGLNSRIVATKGEYSLYLSVGSRGGYTYLSYRVIKITNPDKFVSLCSRGAYTDVKTLCGGWASKKLAARAAANWADFKG